MHDSSLVAVIDHGMGNLFSVTRACERVRLRAVITNDPEQVRTAAAVILPGVGAFRSAMQTLEESGLSDAIREVVATGKPFVGICLGIQLLMTESFEFGSHRGLGIIPGRAVSFRSDVAAEIPLKVPHMQWNRVKGERRWGDTLLARVPDGAFMYFVHSYYVIPDEPGVTVATTTYGGIEFCSALQHKNVFACQFHPEKSGPVGLRLYENLAARLIGVRSIA